MNSHGAVRDPATAAVQTRLVAGAGHQLFEHLMPFWSGPARDPQTGGWVPWMANDGRVDFSQPLGLILHTRLLWTFSAVHRFHPGPLTRSLAERAFEIVTERFWDKAFGGACWHIDRNGNVLESEKKIYGQAFSIYALTEFYRAFDHAPALDRAIELFDLLERHARDTEHGGFWEVCSRDWTSVLARPLSAKDLNEEKSMNNHLHLLEAFTNLHRVWPDPRVAARLRELILLFERHIVDGRSSHCHHFFDEQWRPRSHSYTFGHDIECSWLLCEAAEVVADPALCRSAQSLALRMAEAVLAEGLHPHGGLCYEGGAGQVIDAGREWWPQAEALVGLANAFQIAGETKFLDAAAGIWDFIDTKVVDRVHGEWFWRIQPDGQPDDSLPKVSEWKDPYHAARACLELIHRLQPLATS